MYREFLNARYILNFSKTSWFVELNIFNKNGLRFNLKNSYL
jgi:hypothetical protein